MDMYSEPMEPQEPTPLGAPGPQRERQFGEGRGGIVLAIMIVAGLAGLALAILLIPGFLVWLVSLGLLAIVIVGILAVIVVVVMFFASLGVGAFYLFRKHEVQGPEVSYTLDMVKPPKKENL
jgi:hypothetical protein